MKILFINANLYGHINPTLGLVKKLTEKGNQVNYFCSGSFAEQVTEAGAKWIDYTDEIDHVLKEYKPTDRHPFFMLMEYILSYDEVVLPVILKEIQNNTYDFIICDSIFGGACFLKQLIQVPVICSHSSFAMSKAPVPKRMLVHGFHQQLDHCYQILKRICDTYQIKQPTMEEVFTSKGDLNIVYTTYTFNGDDGVKEPDYLFNGPSVERSEDITDIDFSLIENRKVIYISLGSFNTDFVDFYRACISAFEHTDFYVYMSIGRKCKVTQLGEIPSNFLVREFLPQLEVFKHTNVFITHAGFNSVNEALYFGVPMLALPQVNDQHKVASHITMKNLGLNENMQDLTPELLRTKIALLLTDKQIKENCLNISMEMKNSANMAQTVDKLMNYAIERRERN